MADVEQRLQDLAEDLQELISLTAQNADRSNVNIVTRFESFEKEFHELNAKRWSAFKWAVGTVLGVLSVLTSIMFMYLERNNNQVLVDAQRITAIESNDKDQPSNKDIEKLVKDREIKFKDLELKLQEFITSSKNCVTHKDISQLRADVYDLVLKLHREGKGDYKK